MRPARRGPAGEQGPRGPRGRPGAPPAAAVVTTGPDGRATWDLPEELPAAPVVTAAPVASQGGPLLVVVEEAGTSRVVVVVWQLTPHVVPAGPGVEVHLTATPRSAR